MFDEIEFDRIKRLPKYVFAEVNELRITSYNVCYTKLLRKEALEMMNNLTPEIIISDIMMPVMDGYEFCGKIKNNENFSHIPIILLTAKSDSGSRVEGYRVGADGYISKPFSA